MKSFTDIEQSKKLAEILPLESADAYYKINIGDRNIRKLRIGNLLEIDNLDLFLKKGLVVPSWSLVALLEYLKQRYYVRLDHDGVSWGITCFEHDTDKKYTSSMFDDPIDACWGMILRLNKENYG